MTIHEGDNLPWLRSLAADSCDVCITDPPYATETHDGARTSSSVWTVPKVGHDVANPTQKPLALVRSFVSLFADGSGPVLDPWCGSGTVGVAAVEAGLGFAGCDVDPGQVAIARRRVGDATRQLTIGFGARAKQSDWTEDPE